MHGLECFDPPGGCDLGRELVEDATGDHRRRGTRRGTELEEAGAQGGEGFQPLHASSSLTAFRVSLACGVSRS